MTAVPIQAYKRRPKFSDLTDEDAAKLVKMIKMSSDNNGIMIMKSLKNSINKSLLERRKRPSFKKVVYEWLKRSN